MHLYIDDRFVFFEFSNNEELLSMKEAFTFEDMSKAFAGGSFNKRNIKSISFLKKKGKYHWLFSGFLKDALIIAKEKGIKVESVQDKRTKFEHQKKEFSRDEIKSYLPKYDYVEHQVDALQQLLKKNTGIIKATTGSGKTEIFIALIKMIQLPTLIVVNRITLATQTANRMKNAGIDDIGLFHSKSAKKGKITIATIGSVKKIPNLHDFKMIICDETHRIHAATYQDFLKLVPYPLRFGFSATPNPGDKYKWALIKQFIGDIIYEVKTEKLMEESVIAKPEIEFVDIQCPPTIDWPSANRKCIVENSKRNKVICDLVKKYNTNTLILVKNIEHGELLEETIDGSQFVSGIDDDTVRQNVIQRFEKNELQTIISSNIFNEGISIDNVRLLIIASGGKSKIETIQKIGRSIRSMGGEKKTVKVFDFYDVGNRFTEKHSSMRKNIYSKEGFSVN
jgi:superfamily II DNA or RNA helicase